MATHLIAFSCSLLDDARRPPSIHAGRETGKLADKDLGPNPILYWNSLLFGEFSRKFTHILNTTEFQYWDVEHSESHRNPVRVISFSSRNFVGKLIHLITNQNSSPTLIGLRRPA